jgi:hypothetical protein
MVGKVTLRELREMGSDYMNSTGEIAALGAVRKEEP